MSEHRSVWLATRDRHPYPSLVGDVAVDVVVVGAGITGLTTALFLQRRGADVLVIEADRVGAGTTGHTTGKVTSQHGLVYRRLIDERGEHRARLYAQANQQAIETIASLAHETDADCQLQRAPAYLWSTNAGEREVLDAEHAAAVSLGLPASLTTDTDLPFPVEQALRFDGQAHLHAGRYLEALARAVIAGGGQVCEHTRAIDVDERPDHALVRTEGGDVRAAQVVLATLVPFVDIGGFFAKTRPTRAYGVAARLASGDLEAMHLSVGSPTRSTRPWRDGIPDNGGRPGLIVVGGNHPTGDEQATPGQWGELERWAREHFDIESFDYRWSAQDYTTADGVPYVGRSPRMERTFVATGFAKWGLTNGTAAAHVLAEVVTGGEHPWLELYDATRIGDAATVKKLVEDSIHVGKRFVRDRLERLRAESVEHLAPGEGGLVEIDGDTVAAHRDAAGRVHAVSATCTHQGCTVGWNAAESSWDCPCHGSRFSHQGEVLNGPAVEPLARLHVEQP